MNNSQSTNQLINRIFITGATGFVGAALARELLARGHEVVALTRPTSDRSALADLPIEWREGDVLLPETLRGLLDDVDGVIHAAGMLGQAGVPESAFLALHEGGTRNMLVEARAAIERNGRLQRILHVSSPGVLGPIGANPADETAPLAPSNPYERSKAAAERVAQQFAAGGLPVVTVRPEFIYGPTDLHVLGLFQAVQKGQFFYVDGGTAVCHPTYIDDAVQGMLLALNKGQSGEIYHITGANPVSFRELGETIAAALGVRPPWLRLPKPLALLGAWGLEQAFGLLGKTPPLSRTGVAFFSEDRRFSWQKAAVQLGYAPQFTLEKGVATTVAWYRAQGLLP